MSYLHSFSGNDVFMNRMITHPEYEFVFYSGSAYINNDRNMGRNIPTGSISLYEYNVDRDGTVQQLIYPFIIKDGFWLSFPGVTTASYENAEPGEMITGSYPLTASMTRQYFHSTTNPFAAGTEAQKNAFVTNRKKLIALQNTMNYYRYISDSYEYTSTYDHGIVNMLEIPSIFFDSGIEKGSVDLKFFYTGSLMARAVDSRHNGELISTMGTTSGSVVGIVMYNEGFIMLTSSANINTTSYDDYLGTGDASTNVNPKWVYFGSYLATSSASGFPTASLSMVTFKGTQKIPTMTMFATAQPGQLNNSTNPTWISSSNGDWRSQTITGSQAYVEPRQLIIKNTIESQYCEFEDEFQKQTFITQIGIFDDDKNLIGVAKLANPVMKKEIDEYTFKLKLDL
jgi:hypothetical protein